MPESVDHNPAALAHPRWRRLRATVNARLFGDPQPTVGRYRLLRALGSGAMGTVWGALDTELQRQVALKLLLGDRDPDQQRRIRREAQALARVDHPNVVGVYDVGEHDGEVYVAMELVTGRTLRAWLDARERDWREIAGVFAGAARGLAAAHAAGLVHRDVKPGNILVGDDGRVRVVDFGLVTRGASSSGPLAEDGLVVEEMSCSIPMAGTPAYMAPEQLAGRPVDARADVWSLCVGLFEALARRHPFDRGSVAATLTAIARGDIAWPAGLRIPAPLRRLLRRGLEPDRDRRDLDAQAMADALERLPARRRRLAIATAGAALALVGSVGLVGVIEERSPCPREVAAIAGAWDDDRRAAVERRLTASIADAAPVLTDLDEYRTRLGAALGSACEDGPPTATALAVRACLVALGNELDGATAVLADADETVARGAPDLVSALGDPHGCVDPRRRGQIATDGPVDADARARLAGARALWNAGDDRAASAAAQEVITGTDRTDPIVADAIVLAAEIDFIARNEIDAYVEPLRALAEQAERSGRRATAARVRALLVMDPDATEIDTLPQRFAAARDAAADDPEANALLAVAVRRHGRALWGLDPHDADFVDAALAEARLGLGEGHRLVRALDRDLPFAQPSSPPVRHARDALARARAQWGDRSGAAGSEHVVLGRVLARTGEIGEALDELALGTDILAEVAGPGSIAHVDAAFELLRTAIADDELAIATRVAEQLLALPIEASPPRGRSRYDAAEQVAEALLRTGELAGAQVWARRAAQDPDRFSRVTRGLVLAEVLRRTGDPRAALDETAALARVLAGPEAPAAPISNKRARVALARGLAELALGDASAAEADIAAARADLLSNMPRDHVAAAVGMAAARMALGAPTEARTHLDEVANHAARLDPRDPLRAEYEALARRL